MTLDPTNTGLIIVAAISSLTALASNRASSKAARLNSKEDAERGAYERAQTMDGETIDRQKEEIKDLTEDNKLLRAEIKRLRKQLEGNA